ncbi:MAG: TolC family protein [Caulobacteraceae bacterium]|nr:TolC family protein [Caulobacteraceae bacterium]
MRRALVLMGVGASIAACAAPVLPPLEAPRPVPGTWTQAALPAQTVDDRWWRTFDDPLIDRLIALADTTDDVALAAARLREAEARGARARALLRPEVAASGSADSARVDDLEQSQAEGLASLIWSPDLNGAAGARARSALAATEAEAARFAAVRQATRGQTVRLVVLWAEADSRAAAGEAAVVALEETLRVAETRARTGLTSGLDPASARAELAAARAHPLAARQAAHEARLALEALLGLTPGALTEERPTLPGAHLAAGAAPPVEVLARRPDLRAAEADLRAAGFDAEAARRDFWPTVSLSAALGGRWVDPETPFSVSGPFGSVAGSLSAPLFSFGRLETARDGTDALRDQAAIAYRRAATQALAEVETALAALSWASARARVLEQAVVAANDRRDLADRRHRAGVTSILDVLTADLALSQVTADLAGARADVARAWIALSLAQGLGAG